MVCVVGKNFVVYLFDRRHPSTKGVEIEDEYGFSLFRVCPGVPPVRPTERPLTADEYAEIVHLLLTAISIKAKELEEIQERVHEIAVKSNTDFEVCDLTFYDTETYELF